MIEKIRIENILPSLSSAKKVTSVDHKQKNGQQHSFKKAFQERQKKKNTKRDVVHPSRSGQVGTKNKTELPRHTTSRKNSKKTSPYRSIDIIV